MVKITDIFKKSSIKKKIYEKAKSIFVEMLGFYPHSVVYTVFDLKEKENSDGGCLAISFTPTTKRVDLYIYRSILDEISYLNEKQIAWLKFSIAHEVGHLFVWELARAVNIKYNKDLMEKAATDIAFILVDLHDRKYGKK